MKTFMMMWERDVNSDIDHPEKKPMMDNGTLGWMVGTPTIQPTPVHLHFIYRNSQQLLFHGHVSPVRRPEALGRTGILRPLSSLGLL